MTTLTLPSLACPPRFGTPRRPERPTLGPLFGELHRRLFRELPMPWQQHVYDVALELDPTRENVRTGEAGGFAYDEVYVLVPRQNGKTTLVKVRLVGEGVLGQHLDRAAREALGLRQPTALTHPRHMIYGAQNGVKAREQWEELVVHLERHPVFRSRIDARRTAGAEQLSWVQSASWHRIIRKSEEAGHGDTLHLAVLDELWAQQSHAVVDAAIKPTMNTTRPWAQLWGVTTEGTDDSVLLAHVVDLGRVAADAHDTTVAYFEWSAPPDADRTDPAVWAACMPALGITIGAETVRSVMQTMPPLEFDRAYLNIRSKSDRRKVPAALWAGRKDDASKVLDPITLAVDVAWDRSHTTIAAAGRNAAGQLHVELVARKPGTGWAPEALAALAARFATPVRLDTFGPAGTLLEPLARLKVDVDQLDTRRVCAAAADLWDDIVEGRLVHLGDPLLDDAVAGAVERPVGDAWTWGRKTSSTDISPLVAVTLAAAAARSPVVPVVRTLRVF